MWISTKFEELSMTPEDVSKQLLETFSEELESLLTIMTDHLKQIEQSKSKGNLKLDREEISRAGRNIKVSAYSVGIQDLGKIAEHIEKLFGPLQESPPEILNLGFRAVEGMREALQDYIDKKPISDNLHSLLKQLQRALNSGEYEDQSPIVKENPF